MSMASPVATPGSRWSGSSSDHWSQRGTEVEIKNNLFLFIFLKMRTAVIKQIIGILVRFV